jgi:HEAT repeat protein
MPLKLALSDEDSNVRRAAASALIAIEGELALNEVRLLLEDEDVWVRYHIIVAMGDIGKADYGPLLAPYLNDDQDIIKIAAAKALAALGYAEAAPAIEKLTEERNQDVVEAARAAARKLEAAN